MKNIILVLLLWCSVAHAQTLRLSGDLFKYLDKLSIAGVESSSGAGQSFRAAISLTRKGGRVFAIDHGDVYSCFIKNKITQCRNKESPKIIQGYRCYAKGYFSFLRVGENEVSTYSIVFVRCPTRHMKLSLGYRGVLTRR